MFRLETWQTEAEFKQVMVECMAAYTAAWDRGYRGQAGIKFEPQIETLLGLFASRMRQFVTCRKDGRVVALQHWLFVRDIESVERTLACMNLIFKEDPDACNTQEFLRFGVEQMRAQGASQISMLVWSQAPGLLKSVEAIGGKLGDYLMEIP